MKKYISVVFFLLSLSVNCWSQELYYLQEGFENPESINKWTVSPIIINKTWEYTYGGQWEYGGEPYNPEIPAQGNFNAGLYFPALKLDTVKLISPTLELNGAGKPTLRFFHCQYEKPVKGPDFLRLFFRSGSGSKWDLIHQWTSDIPYWKDEIFDIEDIDSKYLTDSFQIAFEGIIGNGYGVYVDSVTVREDTILQKFIKKTTYSSLKYDAIPAGATNIPLEEVTIRILGNTGNLFLKSLSVIPTGSGVGFLETNSFKLYCTNSDVVFAPFINDTSAVISTGSLVAGKVTFNNISKKLLLGDNHFWVAASFTNTLTGQKTVRFSVPANGINVSNILFPATATNFDETHVIKESVFYDDFETGGSGWTMEGDFEVGWPEGNQVASQSDPKTPFNGLNILANNLAGGYIPNIDSTTAYYAYMPEQDLKYYIKVGLYMQSYIAINGSDKGVIDVSTDGGTSWQNIWTSDASSNNSYWTELYDESINEIAKRQSRFQVRFGIISSESTPWPGFNIDNFALIAEKLHTDIGLTEILEPFNDCLDCGNDTVKVWIKNYADSPAPNAIPLFYSLQGVTSTHVKDTLFGGIAIGDSVLFTFKKTAAFPIADYYTKFIVGVNLSGDQDLTNDTLTKPIIIQKNISPPHFENFEYKGGVWLPSANSTWTNKNMTGTITTDPLSPNIWVLSPTGNYRNNENSFVESGCYNLSDPSRNVLEFKYWSDCENTKDGARFEYTLNDGITWKIMEDSLHNVLWNWTTNNVTSLGSKGWSGIHNWTNAKSLIPLDADNASKVKFRILFMSDNINAQPQGFAFDDLRIYATPADVGVSSITIPKDSCQFIYGDSVQVFVKNYGYNKMNVNDTMIIGLDFENDPVKIDTVILSSNLLPGDSAKFTIPLVMNILTPGLYNLKAFTLIEDNPLFYGTNNDTAYKSFEVWQNPFTLLADTISSRQPDTVVIRPHVEPEYTFLWGDNSTSTTYDVDNPGTYYLTVTESNHGCKTQDSVYVELLFNDVGIDSIVWPISACELGNSEKVEILIYNSGNDSLVVNDKILLSYQIDGGSVVRDSVTLSSTFHSGTHKWFRFEHKTENFSLPNSYSIKAYTYFGGDTIQFNDTIIRTINVFGFPDLDLGNDTIVKALSFDISVNPGFVSYLWSDGNTEASRTITNSGSYWLEVTDLHGCPAIDTINIWFKIRDISIAALLSPVSECERTGTDQVEVQLTNNGTDTLSLGNNIMLSYKVDNNARVSSTIQVTNFLPGSTYTYIFSGTVNINAIKSYQFNLTASTSGDLRTENDTLNDLVYTSNNPDVNFGVEDYEHIYETSYTLNAGVGSHYSYLWHDGSTEQTYTATDIETISVIVTDTITGCYGGDTVILYLDILDYMVSSIDISNEPCLGQYKQLGIEILNNGNLPRAGADLTLNYSLDNTLLFTENYQTTGNWMAGTSKLYTTQNEIDLNSIGSHNLQVEVIDNNDLRPENDLITKPLDVLSSPIVNFGGSSLMVDLPYTLDAGAGATSYLWNTGSTNRYLTVTADGIYSVTVTGTNSCKTTQRVGINVPLIALIETANKVNMLIFPNPADEYFTIQINFDLPVIANLEIFDAQNKLALSREIDTDFYTEEFNVSDLPPGVYFVRIRNSDINYVGKMIIH